MSPQIKKRQVDFQVIAQWVAEGDRVLDLGCGRGVLLEYLQQTKKIYAVGVDIELDKIIRCVKRGVSAYHGDAKALLQKFEENSFDRVILSRSVEQLDEADETLADALRVGKRVTVGFINHGFWLNRYNYTIHGRRTMNDVYNRPWYQTQPANLFSIQEFENYCRARNIRIENKVYLAGDWEKTIAYWPNLMAGYAIYDLSKVD